MKRHLVESVEIAAPVEEAFCFIADPKQLPQWTQAFRSVGDGRALMETPNGSVEIGLSTFAARDQGTIDWKMSFPDGSIAWAYSRLLPGGEGNTIYTFTLMAPPTPLEKLEGVLEEQGKILRHELANLQRILNGREEKRP